MRDLCYVMSKRAQRQLEISDEHIANEPKVQPRATFVLKASLIFTLAPSCPGQCSTRSPSLAESGCRRAPAFAPGALALHVLLTASPISDSVRATEAVVAGGTTRLRHGAMSKRGRRDKPRAPPARWRDSGWVSASLRHCNKSTKPNHAQPKSALETAF